MKRRSLNLLVFLILMTLILSGCGQKSANDDQTQGTPKDSLVVAVSTEAANLDPQNHIDLFSYLISKQIYDSLLVFNNTTNEYENRLAESVEKAADGLSITVKIKEGVQFSNGEELKASDVKFTYDRAAASPKFGARVAQIADCQVIDDYTVKLNLKEPYAPSNSLLCVYIVNEKAVTAAGEEYGNSVDGVVGTGAYLPVKWDKGEKIELTRNDNYFGDKAKIKDVIVRVIPEPSTASIALEKGEIDYLWEVTGDALKTLQQNSEIEIIHKETMETTQLILNCSKPPFDNADLRRAIAYAIDRDAATLVATNGTSKSVSTYLPKGAVGLAEDVVAPARDLEKAKEYLAKAGYPNGLNIKILAQNDASELFQPVIQANLAEIGITAEIEMMEFGAAYDKKFAMDYELSDSDLVNRLMDADFLYQWYKSDSGNNMIGYSNPEFDQLLVDGRKEMDPAKRDQIYKRAQEILRDEAVIIPIYQWDNYQAFNANLEGIEIPVIDVNQFKYISWKN